VATWDDVRAAAGGLPETEEGTLYRQPAFRVRGKAFAWLSPHEHGALVLRCDEGERPLMIEARPDVFWTSPHYDGYPMVLVHLDAIDLDELEDRVAESWLLAAPPKLAAELEAG
jgi:hypothetical protein